MQAIHGLEDFWSRRMPGVLHQECHYTVALRSAAQSACLQAPFNFFGIHGN